MIKVETVQVTDLYTNCYIIKDSKSGDCAVIDPGEFTNRLDKELSMIGYDKIKYILLTHSHFDHIGGVKKLAEKTGGKAEVALSEKEIPYLNNPLFNLSSYFNGISLDTIKADIALHDGDIITLGDSIIKVILTPGHTCGSVCFVCDGKIFSGDTLFYMSHGRTDFPTGDESEMIASLKKLADLPGKYTVYPGHDRLTELDFERNNNPYIRK